MNIEETSNVLGKIQTFDQRNVDQAHLLAWSEALADVDYALALDAVTAHYRATQAWIGPSNIRQHIREVERQRMRDAGPPDYPSDLSQAQERAYRAVWLDHVKRGVLATEATVLADEALSIRRGELIAPPDEARKAITEFARKRNTTLGDVLRGEESA